MAVIPDEPRWGSEPVDVSAYDLPALKASFLLRQVPSHGNLLELGCGEGKLLRTLARERPELRLIGCDVRDVAPADAAFEFRRLLGPIPAHSRELDCAVFMDVLEHVEDPAFVLDELFRVLRPGGRLVGFVPLEGQPWSAYALYRRLFGADLYRVTKHHVQSFTHAEVRRLLSRFELVEQRYAYHALGQLLDASFFAAARVPRLGRFWWRENRYYHPTADAPRPLSRLLNSALGWGNRLAFAESTLLSRVRWLSAGLLFAARRP